MGVQAGKSVVGDRGGLWFTRCARLFVHSLCSAICSLAALGRVFRSLRSRVVSFAALSRVGLGIHAFFRCHPWQYESLLSNATKVTKNAGWLVAGE